MVDDEFYNRLMTTRHHIHQHPEVSESEYETTDYIKTYLRKLGIVPLDYPLETG